MQLRTFFAYATLVVFSISSRDTFAEPTKTAEMERAITDADSVLAIYTQDYGLVGNGRESNQLIFAAWPDGRLVWSEDATHGGPPYRTAQIHPARLEKALAQIKRNGYFNDAPLKHAQFGPDANTTVIFARTKRQELKMQSWHELYEESGKTIATDAGLSSLTDQSRPDALRGASADYLFYRIAWADLRLLAASLIPSESKPTNGRLEFREGKANWVEQSP
jgi:hypothetical protein